MTRFRLSAKADADLRSIAAYTEKQWGRRQRDIYIRELFEVFASLADTPEIAQRIDEIRQGYRKFPQGAHVIFFRESDSLGMEIIRILHNRMDADLHLDSP
ncbi:MAG: type II toxin-antitoxin system RelE/ParE family toxin [Gammaproteobacteria bacterium]|nr:type II toxin-antitoxin system RelE/ParE family toxin [Gammaproteobacteria bacterium]